MLVLLLLQIGFGEAMEADALERAAIGLIEPEQHVAADVRELGIAEDRVKDPRVHLDGVGGGVVGDSPLGVLERIVGLLSTTAGEKQKGYHDE